PSPLNLFPYTTLFRSQCMRGSGVTSIGWLDRSYRLLKIRIPCRPGGIVLRKEKRFGAGRWRLHDKFRAACGRKQNRILFSGLDQWISIERDDLERHRLVIDDHLKRREILKSGVRDAPKLLFAWLHLDHRLRSADDLRNLVVKRQLIRPGNPWNLKLLA